MRTRVGNRDWADILEAGRGIYSYMDSWGRYKHRHLFTLPLSFKLRRMILSKVLPSKKSTGEVRPVTISRRRKQSRWAELVYGKAGFHD